MKYDKTIIKEAVNLLKEHEGTDRYQNLDNVALVLGVTFAYLNGLANKQDCREIVERAMEKIGWTNGKGN